MQCPCGDETKPFWNLVNGDRVTECKGCGRRYTQPEVIPAGEMRNITGDQLNRIKGNA